MLLVEFIVGDDFEEAKHPRDNDGKFATGSGGGGGGGAKPSNAVLSTLKKHGFVKVKSADNLPSFYNVKTGVKVVIHPDPKTTAFTKKFAIHAPGKEPLAGEKGEMLDKHLSALIEKATEKASIAHTESEEDESPETMALYSTVEDYGFTAEPGAQGNTFNFQNTTGSHIIYDPSNNGWVVYEGSKFKKNGNGLGSLNNYLADTTPPIESIDTKQPDAVAKATEDAGLKLKNVDQNILAEHSYAYKSPGNEPGSVLFTKKVSGGDAFVQVNPTTLDWTVKTPGFPTKEGNGTETLKSLLSGGKVQKLESGGYSWNNSSKSIGPEAPAKPKPEAPEHEKLLKKIAEWRAQPTSLEAEALSNYKGSGYKALNTALRHNHGNKGSFGSTIAALDSYLKRSTIKEPVTLMRTVSNDANYVDQLMSMAFVGAKIQDKGFISSTTKFDLNFKGGSGAAKIKINVPAGSMGATIKPGGAGDGEYEVLLMRDSVYVVKSYDPVNRYLEVDLDQSLVPKEAT